MEEFYRRKYLSPTYSRASSYLETLEKDKTVAELRKELQDCKEMEEKFDDLCLEIVKLERENKKIESEQSQIEGEYMEKIKRNKGKITELKQAILDCREDIQTRNKKIAAMEADNDKLLEELQRTKRDAEENRKEKTELGEKITMQNDLISELKAKIEEGKVNSIESKKENQLKSEELEKNYQELKKNQQKLKEEQLQCEETRIQLDRLGKEKDDWSKKVEASKQRMMILQGEWELQNKENAKLESEVKEMSNERSKMSESSAITEKELQRTLMKSKEGCCKIKTNQVFLMQSVKNLQKDQIYLEKVTLQEAELKKENERLEEMLKHLTEILGEEQESYTRIIGHMKQSIVQDEKAIESLSKQANMLEHLIV